MYVSKISVFRLDVLGPGLGDHRLDLVHERRDVVLARSRSMPDINDISPDQVDGAGGAAG